MRRRLVAAAAGGDSMRRRRRLFRYGWVAASASGSGAPTTPVEARCLQATPAPVIMLFLHYSVLTSCWLCVAGTPKERKNCRWTTMAASWKYAAPQLEPGDAVLLLRAGRAPELVQMKEYCLNMPVVSILHTPGALPQLQEDGTMAVDQNALLAEPAQELTRSALLLLDDLFEAGYWLSVIDETTLVVDTSNASVLLSAEAMASQVTLIRSPKDIDATIASLAVKLEEYLFEQNHLAVDIPEVAGLFSLMKKNGNEMWYAIVNNMALAPLENRREVFVRMYEQLQDVVRVRNRVDYEQILQELEFPPNWHDAADRKLNCLLFILYGGAIYDATAPSKDQAEQITRFVRNSGVHVLGRLGSTIGRSDVSLIHISLAPKLAFSLQSSLQKRGWLASTDMHTLFVYARRRRASS